MRVRKNTIGSTYVSKPPLDKTAERKLIKKAKKGDKSALNKLIEHNIKFIWSTVASIVNKWGGEFEDLLQEGIIGYMRGIEKFDFKKDVRLNSYAVSWVNAYVRNHLFKSVSVVKFGTNAPEKAIYFSLNRVRSDLTSKLGRDPTLDELAAALNNQCKGLNIKPDKLNEIAHRLDFRDFSVDTALDQSRSMDTFVAIMPSADLNPEELLLLKEHQEQTKTAALSALSVISDRERFVVFHRIMSDDPLTLQEVGEKEQYSRERTRQLENRAINKMTQKLQGAKINGYKVIGKEEVAKAKKKALSNKSKQLLKKRPAEDDSANESGGKTKSN